MIYYTVIGIGESLKFVGLASLYGLPDRDLLEVSEGTYWTAQHTHQLQFVDVHCIKQVVMMAPDPHYKVVYSGTGDTEDRWHMMQKPGVALLGMMGIEEDQEEGEGEGEGE